MPELPDVEVFKGYLDATSLHQRIREVEVVERKVLAEVSARALGEALGGRTFATTRRHGKYLLVKLEEGLWMTLHFGMTGSLKYFKGERAKPLYGRLLVHFDNGFRLAYVSRRMLGKVGLAEGPEGLVREKGLGPDALGLDSEAFAGLFKKTGATVKSALMDQGRIAGVGNIYSDEVLFQAGIHPETRAHGLTDKELRELFGAMRRVLALAIRRKADPARLPRAYLVPNRREGGRCPRCKNPLERTKVSGRKAYYCPRRQPRPR